MRNARLWRELLGVDRRTVIEGIEFDEAGPHGAQLVARVRSRNSVSARCGRCGCRASWYDRGEGRRRWRGLDWGTVQVVLEADAPRVNCAVHGPTVLAVPWARHHAGHTYAFDDTVAWLAVACSKTAVCQLMRIAWRTVGTIVARVWADTDESIDRFATVRRIGIDEISYKRGHNYITVVVDHDSGRLIWAAAGRDNPTLNRFFDALGSARCAQITHVSADAAGWIADVVTQRCPAAIRCADPFHVVSWATTALDVERRRAWNDARVLARAEGKWTGAGPPRVGDRPGHERVRSLQHARYALWKNPETSPNISTPSWPGSPRPTPGYIVPTCSKRASGMSFRSKVPTANRPWTGGSPGRVAAVSRSSYSWPDASSNTRQSIDSCTGPRPVPRTDRIGQHQDPPTNPNRLRLPLTTKHSSP